MRLKVAPMAVVVSLALVSVGGAAQADSVRDRPVEQDGEATDAVVVAHFDRVVALESTSETSANVGIGDVNGDGHLDIVLAKGRHWPLVDRVLLGDGHGRFPTARDLGAASDRSYAARLVDIDNDGDLDVIISNDAPDPKLVYLNDGRGDFRVGSTYGRAEWPSRNATVADINSDGLFDIIVANRTGDGSGANYVCLNRGMGKFDADCTAFSHESATTITPADFNHDGLMDLAVPHRDGGQSYVYLNEGEAGLPNFRRVPFGPAHTAVRMSEPADLDLDGTMDIVAIERRRGVAVYFGQATGTFSSGVPIGDHASAPYALAVGDMNLDGTVDIIVGNVQAPSTVYFNDGSGRRFNPVEFGDNEGTVYGFAIGDLDEDGRPDIAVARSDAPNVLYLAGPPSGTDP